MSLKYFWFLGLVSILVIRFVWNNLLDWDESHQYSSLEIITKSKTKLGVSKINNNDFKFSFRWNSNYAKDGCKILSHKPLKKNIFTAKKKISN